VRPLPEAYSSSPEVDSVGDLHVLDVVAIGVTVAQAVGSMPMVHPPAVPEPHCATASCGWHGPGESVWFAVPHVAVALVPSSTK
jgi:hypothetical protein